MAVNKKRITPIPDKTVPLFQKHLSLLAFIGCILLPVISNFALSLILSDITGDILLKTAADILGGFVTALNSVGLFFVYGVLINSIVRFGFKESKNIIILCFIRVFLIYTAYLAIGAIMTADLSATITGNLYACFTNGLVDVMLLCGALALTGYLRSRYLDENKTNVTIKSFFPAKNPLLVISAWVVVLISAFLLSGCVITTISDVMLYGATDLTSSEVVYLVSPYVSWLIKTVSGYVVIWLTAKWLDSRWSAVSLACKKD